MIKLSHTMKDKVLTCPKMYDLHYNQKIRSARISSPLFFGSAIDVALNRMLLDKKNPLNYTEEEHILINKTPKELFTDKFNNIYHNGKIYKPSDIEISYSDKDIDVNFLSDNEKDLLYSPKLTTKEYNELASKALYSKGLQLIDNYEKELLPQIKEVKHIQKAFSLKQQGGENEIVGNIDFICEFIDEPNIDYICDNKTSSKSYGPKSVIESQQLATYAEAELITKGAYFVMRKDVSAKGIYKTQIVRDNIPESLLDSTFSEYDKALQIIEHGIKTGEYPMCKQNCNFQFGRKCDYYYLCHNNDMTNLVKLEKKDKKEEK